MPNIKTATFQDEMPCGLIKNSQHFGGACCLLVAECLFYPDYRKQWPLWNTGNFLEDYTWHIILDDSNLNFHCLENLTRSVTVPMSSTEFN
jgi:hypothetical protein